MTAARRLWPWLRMLGGAAILGVLVWRLGTGAFLDGLRVVDGRSALAALVIGLLTTVVSAWRWCVVARRLGLRLSLPGAVADCYRALFLNVTLPAGVLGDVHRAVSHGRRSGNVGRGVRAVVLERFAGQVVLVAVGAAVLLSQPTLVEAMARHLVPGSAGGAVAAVLVVCVLVVCGLVGLGLAVWALMRRGPATWRRTLSASLSTAWSEGRVALLSRDTWPRVALLSAAAVAGHLALFLVAARAAGSQATVAELLPPLVLTLLVMGLPVNIGGWGPREAASTLAFGATGLGAAQGLTAAVVYGVLTLVSTLPGAVVLFVHGRRRAITP
ncbi:hypothetical protein Pth03_70590 [Planotetraspora thailandica]|uniref:Dolichol-P-glucose synthetase-like protein n=1 Tax=Planotetraspora thailandica TaxID=487172 RepID=A0A8J3Y0N5_9ACTN|nr:lysylphosphatidylglycerol synthase transmembrane domain-containing protein [Planotetraspora thailandica]GII58670.1 hypothetical protein Pth03_70590 [Planotetraspora thailandica]